MADSCLYWCPTLTEQTAQPGKQKSEQYYIYMKPSCALGRQWDYKELSKGILVELGEAAP